MHNRSNSRDRRGIFLSLIFLGLLASLIVLPNLFKTEAGNDDDEEKARQSKRTKAERRGLENYDIRNEKSPKGKETLLRFRDESGKTASGIADIRESFVRGEEELRSKVKSLKIEYNLDLRIPEVISPAASSRKIERLAGRTNEKNAETLRNFVKQYDQLVGMTPNQIDGLRVIADYTNPRGNMAFAHLVQEINGVPVFRGEIKAGFTTNGEIVRVINNLAPGLEYNALSKDFGNPLAAVESAAGHMNYKLQIPDITRNEAASSDLKVVFGEGDWATTAEKMYFPTSVGVARPAWRVLIWQPGNVYYVIVDAETGTMLWRKNIVQDQTTSATYDIYNNTNAFTNVSESPFPGTPGPVDPATADAATDIGRSTLMLIGNEAPNTFNDNGWITDGGDRTDGNNVQAGLDIVAPDGIDVDGEAIEVTPGGRDFQFTFSPYNPNDGTGDAPTTADARNGGVTQLFYICNRYHDSMYLLGFTEQALNFQDDNFGRGGTGGDRLSAESQDSSGTNNANMATPADGGRGRMQMFRWTLEGPGLDGSLDGDIVIHEFTHGLSNRLHGNIAGLNNNMGGMMGEGWSDFYAHALLSEPSDPANGIYTLSGWATSGILGALSSYYYGIRRFPKAPLAFTGGAMNRPHNPITFADIDQTTVDYSDGAFPAPTAGHLSGTADQVHTGGEVWSSALWEVRTLMVSRLGFAAGNERALQVVTDGMKLAPLNPDYLQERDAIIMAAAALPLAPAAQDDVDDVREGFRIRGMGFASQVLDAGTGGGTARVFESFDFLNAQHVDPFSVSDAPGDNDGFPEPGEDLLLSIPVTNATGSTITNVMANVDGGTNVAYGTLNDTDTVTMQIPYTVPGGAACGSFQSVQINVSSDSGAQLPFTRTFRLGEPVGGPPVTFENTTPFDVPAMGGTSGPADPYPSTINVSGLAGDKLIKVELTDIAHTWVDDIDVMLEAPNGQTYLFMGDVFGNTDDDPPVTVTFSDNGADGPAPNAGPLTAGDYQPINVGAGDIFAAPAPAIIGDALNGDTFQSVFGMDGSTMNGDWKLWIMDDAGGDIGTIGGWKITFEDDSYVCSLGPSGIGRADFDGDGRTDQSVFRPSEGNWYVNGSTDGFFVLNWGLSTDTLVPGDYDGDGKTDTAVFRPADAPGTPDFYILNSNGFTFSGAEWGLTGDTPVIGDYDGDGNDDISVWRESDTTWYTLNSMDGSNSIDLFGLAGDVPVVGDWDGDGKVRPGIFRPSNNTWYLARAMGDPGTNFDAIPFGMAADNLVPGDYDGDGKTDVAVWRPTDGSWYILNSGSGATTFTAFGIVGDIPVPGDYDGDGKDDFAVYRGGDWWTRSSQSGTTSVTSFGLASDIPIPSRANP